MRGSRQIRTVPTDLKTTIETHLGKRKTVDRQGDSMLGPELADERQWDALEGDSNRSGTIWT